MKRIERDVIVVGAGPGGSATAGYLAMDGLDVLLVDKEIFPRDKPCADAQSPATAVNVEKLGALDKLADVGMPILKLAFSSDNYDIAEAGLPVSDAFITPRWIFDNLMRQHAEELGAEVYEDCWVYDLIREDGFVRGVRAKYQGEYIEIRSKIVIGADGSHSVVAKACGMFPEVPQAVTPALRTYFDGVDCTYGTIELHYDRAVYPGYIWIFPSGKESAKHGFCNVGLGMLNRTNYIEPSFEERFWEWVDRSPWGKRLKNARQVAPWKGWRVPCAQQRMKNYDNGVMLVGDAGSHVIPLVDEGISAAMDSGRFAAETAKEAIEAGDCSGEFLKRFKDKFDSVYTDRIAAIQFAEDSWVQDRTVTDLLVDKMKNDTGFAETAMSMMFVG